MRVAGARGALFDHACARIQPAKLARGLAEAAERAGARIFEGTEVTAVEPRVARTAAGDVRARLVVRATEGYIRLPACVAPISSLDDRDRAAARRRAGRDRLARRRDADRRAQRYFYLQRTADGRSRSAAGRAVPLARRASPRGAPRRPHDAALRDRLVELFPALRASRSRAAWHGVLGVARDWTPAVAPTRARPGFAGGYVGEGVAARTSPGARCAT